MSRARSWPPRICPFGHWGETFSDDVVAAAMIDRLVHHAEVLTLTDDSCRTRQRSNMLAKDQPNRADQDRPRPHKGHFSENR